MNAHFSVTPGFEVRTLEKALRLYTPSLSEKPLTDFLADKCDDLGFEDIQIDEVGNLIAKKGTGSPKIMLCGHMDVVPGKVKVRKEGDLLYGRGASDAKAPLIAMLFAAASIQNNNGTIIFVAAVDEEGSATGIKYLVKKNMGIDYAIFGEPSGVKQVTIAYKGRLAINLKVSVEDSSHASAPWLSKNAIQESIIFAKELKEGLEVGQDGKTKGMLLTATITEIKGGISHNVTPKECETTFDIRIPVDMNCKSTEQKIAMLVKEIAEKRGVEAFYSILDETEPFEAAHNSPLVRAFTLGIIDIEHSRPTLIRKTGTGDMNVLGNQWKIPVVTYGPGDPHEAHTIDEKVSIDEFLRGIEILKKTLQHLKRLHDKKMR
ncbi:M20/M25/M40 family metallo-hydrolase [Marine Group I thaumarchaeote]|uniref:Putative [LysW]-lysine/[LysW]-ornithine hydrolase n=1 Tax=Marine Group I thaumarchaeote TaxID=2511932 RepID=A0A7K4NWQ5_9ARCH|nr:MAG: M20/M25/M40 family metallo-hydrolase [Nitrosopumilus sp. YT1]NMI82056.1 M20/M25/M40 family metallo-hydrolase [Candidatus Nitrosopumilus sp. MTA1]NWJ20269.1 M20/M25/M40 family metallo-hydrolase [Marine Group I thaumarchaeote]NWJ57184.1 M20/M25/M40 family metallo-hydrolase [Marine Group I thaumarchaeote]NWJ84172.1 M20/M25/M40 family metallo-hydrolase [Marine Group I thaumarchaeote]